MRKDNANNGDRSLQREAIILYNFSILSLLMKNYLNKSKTLTSSQNIAMINAPAEKNKKKHEKQDKQILRVFGNDITTFANNQAKSYNDKIKRPGALTKQNQPNQVIYQRQIMKHILNKQNQFMCQNSMLTNERKTNRLSMVKYIFRITHKFELRKETMHLAAYIMDRLLETNIEQNKLVTLVESSLWIAMKYQEIYPPLLKQFVSKDSFTNVLKMESDILHKINFKLTYFSAIMFFRKWAEDFALEKQEEELAQFLIDISILDINLAKYTPAVLSLGAVMLAIKVASKNFHCDLIPYSITMQQIQNSARAIAASINYFSEQCKSIRKNFATHLKQNTLFA